MDVVIVSQDLSGGELMRHIEGLGHSVALFSSAKAASQYLVIDANNVKLIVTDSVMTGVNGLQLIQSIRERDSETPIIAISNCFSATGSFDYLPIAIILGANDGLEIPYSLTQFEQRAQQYLS